MYFLFYILFVYYKEYIYLFIYCIFDSTNPIYSNITSSQSVIAYKDNKY